MASYQRVALFIFFDAIERDLVARIRNACGHDLNEFLTAQEREKASIRLQSRGGEGERSDHDLLHGLDIGDKYAILLRHKARLDQASSDYYVSKRSSFERAVPIRNSTMHGRPLTTDEYSFGFSLANDFLLSPGLWPNLCATYREYGKNPDKLLSISISLLEEDPQGETLNNLPIPDYDDTGFQPRRNLESDLRKKILGRHPVITVLGDGGDGKTALTLQTLYGLLQSNDHDFDAFVWVSAKTNRLTTNEIERIEGAITTSLGIFSDIADKFEGGDGTPIERVRRLLSENKVLLVIDNLETVLDDVLADFAADVPGESKIVFTSRVPLGGDLSVKVSAFSEAESLSYLRRLIEAYDIPALRKESEQTLKKHLARLAHKPLLVKWFAIGVSTGIDPASITANPEIALKFCMENVFKRLSDKAKSILPAMTTVPQPLSATIIQYISQIDAKIVEAGVAELSRFGLIEKSDSVGLERLYRIKPFARAYISRVHHLVAKDADAILTRFRSVTGAYQEERGTGLRNRYDPRSFAVRSHSEALAARRLRHASDLALKGRFDEANKIVSELKITSPDYFEVYRTAAFLQFRLGDLPGALASYEAALEHASDQPQLHFFYGFFLMRSYGDYSTARDQFDLALAMAPSETAILREASRASLYLYEFEKSQEYMNKAWKNGFKTPRDEIIANDLQAQLHIRQAEYLLNAGDAHGAFGAISRLCEFLVNIKLNVIDDLMIDHLRKAMRTIEVLTRSSSNSDQAILSKTLNLIKELARITDDQEGRPADDQEHRSLKEQLHNRSGNLKVNGRKENYGFLQDTFGIETYVSRTSVSAALWKDMCDGRPVRYDIHVDAEGQSWAESVALL